MSVVRDTDPPVWRYVTLAAALFVIAAIAVSKAQIPIPVGSFGRGTPLPPVGMTAECPGVVINSGQLREENGVYTVGVLSTFSVHPDDPRRHHLRPLLDKTVEYVIREVPTRTREVLIRKEVP